MLKKTISTLGIIAILVSLGLVFRYVAVKSTESGISTTPLFTSNLIDANGNAQNLNQYRDKILVVNFWATWCPPCREEMPELSQLHQTYQNKNVMVLGIAIDEPALVKEFLQTSPVSYPVLITENTGMDLSSQLGNDKDVLPYTIVIDTQGKVVKTYFGRVSKPLLEAAIKPLLSQ
jgi:thiol-disulfide isomerase/thioredoxin